MMTVTVRKNRTLQIFIRKTLKALKSPAQSSADLSNSQVNALEAEDSEFNALFRELRSKTKALNKLYVEINMGLKFDVGAYYELENECMAVLRACSKLLSAGAKA